LWKIYINKLKELEEPKDMKHFWEMIIFDGGENKVNTIASS